MENLIFSVFDLLIFKIIQLLARNDTIDDWLRQDRCQLQGKENPR